MFKARFESLNHVSRKYMDVLLHLPIGSAALVCKNIVTNSRIFDWAEPLLVWKAQLYIESRTLLVKSFTFLTTLSYLSDIGQLSTTWWSILTTASIPSPEPVGMIISNMGCKHQLLLVSDDLRKIILWKPSKVCITECLTKL